jgi:formylmethanofuran dehydrogenase subunit C
MRRGLIAVGGSTGDMIGFNMIAGTVLAFGEPGIRPGAGMRRGTIGLLGPNPPPLLPSFRFDTTDRPPIMSVLLRHVRSKGLKFDEALLMEEFDFYRGDLVSVGRGEIIFRHDGRSMA